MKILRSSKEIELSREEFLNKIKSYDDLVIDLGTGQGAFVYFSALENKNKFYVGLDSCGDSMKKYAIKQYKNKLENLVYIIMNAQNIDNLLYNMFSEVYINLPWGSLLEGIFKEELGIIYNISKLLVDSGKMKICFSYNDKFEKMEIEKRNLPDLNESYFDDFKMLYSKYNIEIHDINLVLKDEIPFESKWVKVLGESNRREFYIINGYKKRVQ
ncbi:16S rRNA (adenine(1408)-N(1))-methyltransferase NpmA [Candidatus Arthromitus sp. SFB-rat-Yit]|uniref:16S rRNA (adenine(1408)-N(1))-methyltransferase NpmA n=1 Tax=Candidatus Arthromitus sp. SFB-rat-Yit TaxID=1041504 RepID=UPI000227A77B|nr:16S rRNA (adenine(1408)-N(1))-methyltransferase NpmA [Candidatus Arthromitus sp. SFB-rat-Yit]BAK81735.1 16S rRNA methylase [Candidatus Arthromitus sp. SFB-rat-Yit]